MSPQEALNPEESQLDETKSGGSADARMAEILRGKVRNLGPLRHELREERSEHSEDLLGRLHALEFVDSVVGEDSDIPDQIGEYEITGVLGRGGMGTVYLAYQESLEREVALKVLSPKFSTDLTMRKRFRSEARATAAMHHQHIVPIYDFGETGGHLYFAMERVHGVSLDKHIAAASRKDDDNGALEPREAARRFAGVADALALAHRRQILHRDVKPGNLLVHQDGTLALADFGLSKFLGESSVKLTSVGGFLGTLHYSPPEQARGEDLSPASDLYSLGVTLFETVTGQLPLRGESTEAMLQSLLYEEPKRLRQLVPKAPKDLEAVIEKLLQKDPRDRYADGEALALDLMRVAEGEPVRIRRQSTLSRLYRKARRNPVMTTALGVTLVLLVVTVLLLRAWADNKAGDREALGREKLDSALREIATEEGSPIGPLGLLCVLTGFSIEVAGKPQASASVRDLLTEASYLLPGDPRPVDFIRAYAGDALPTASEKMRKGYGHQAALRIGQELRAIDVYTPNDAVWLSLYSLYLSRALANLTSSVANPAQAREDLQSAIMVRRGAFLPRLLKTLLGWSAPDGTDALIKDLNAVLSKSTAERAKHHRKSAAQVLLAFSGLALPKKAEMMRFPMRYAQRKVLHKKALSWLGIQESPDAAADGRSGLAGALARLAQEALSSSGNSPRLHRFLGQGRNLLKQEVAPGSPLQAWGYVFDLLSSREGMDMPIEQQMLGAIHFLDLVRTEIQVETRKEKFYALLETGKSTAYYGQLRAMLDARLASPEVARQSADAWLQSDPQNPTACICLFRCRLREGVASTNKWPIQRAGLRAMSSALSREVARAEIVGILQEAEHRATLSLDHGSSAALKEILGLFLEEGKDGP